MPDPRDACPLGFLRERKNVGMTATEELHHLLDERGVKWSTNDMHRLLITSWDDANSHSWAFMEHMDGDFRELKTYHLAPEQVVAATMGPGACKDIAIEGEWFECSECRTVKRLIRPNFCPNCGRRVV